MVAKLKEHHRQDEIVQGAYQYAYQKTGLPEAAISFRGCAIGCTLPYLPTFEQGGLWTTRRWHKAIETHYGIPWRVADIIDDLFENLETPREAADFALAVIEAIPVGADLSETTIDVQLEVRLWAASPNRATELFIETLANAPLVP